MTLTKNPLQGKINLGFGLTALLIILISIWLSLDNTHALAKAITGWQISIMGGNKYYVVLTAFVIAIPLLLILMLAKIGFVTFYNQRNPDKPLKFR